MRNPFRKPDYNARDAVAEAMETQRQPMLAAAGVTAEPPPVEMPAFVPNRDRPTDTVDTIDTNGHHTNEVERAASYAQRLIEKLFTKVQNLTDTLNKRTDEYHKEADAKRVEFENFRNATELEIEQCRTAIAMHEAALNIAAPSPPRTLTADVMTGNGVIEHPTFPAEPASQFDQPIPPLEPIPSGIYAPPGEGNFYDAETRQGMGEEFYFKWRGRILEFPRSQHEALGLPTDPQ